MYLEKRSENCESGTQYYQKVNWLVPGLQENGTANKTIPFLCKFDPDFRKNREILGIPNLKCAFFCK